MKITFVLPAIVLVCSTKAPVFDFDDFFYKHSINTGKLLFDNFWITLWYCNTFHIKLVVFNSIFHQCILCMYISACGLWLSEHRNILKRKSNPMSIHSHSYEFIRTLGTYMQFRCCNIWLLMKVSRKPTSQSSCGDCICVSWSNACRGSSSTFYSYSPIIALRITGPWWSRWSVFCSISQCCD